MGEGVKPCGNTDVEDIKIVIFKNTITFGTGRIISQVESFQLRCMTGYAFFVDDNVEGPEALAYADYVIPITASSLFV